MQKQNSQEKLTGSMIRDLIGGRSTATENFKFNPRISTDYHGASVQRDSLLDGKLLYQQQMQIVEHLDQDIESEVDFGSP